MLSFAHAFLNPIITRAPKRPKIEETSGFSRFLRWSQLNHHRPPQQHMTRLFLCPDKNPYEPGGAFSRMNQRTPCRPWSNGDSVPYDTARLAIGWRRRHRRRVTILTLIRYHTSFPLIGPTAEDPRGSKDSCCVPVTSKKHAHVGCRSSATRSPQG